MASKPGYAPNQQYGQYPVSHAYPMQYMPGQQFPQQPQYGYPPPQVYHPPPGPAPAQYIPPASQTIETGGMEVETSVGDTVQNPPNGGCRAWLIVLACFFINLCNTLIQQAYSMSNKSMRDDLDNEKLSKINEVYVDMRMISAPIGAIIAVKFGYRILTIVGGLLMGLGFLIASFLDNDSIDGIGFLIAGLGGIGGAFWSLAAIVAVLEYFKSKRIRALILASSGNMIGALTLLLIEMFVIKEELEWKDTFKYILGPVGVGILAGCTLTPLKLTMAYNTNQSFLGRTLGIFDWDLLRKPALYLCMFVFFLENFGRPLPSNKLMQLVKDFDLDADELLTLMIVTVLSPLAGLISLFFWKNKKLATVLIWMGPVNVLCGILANVAPSLDKYGLLLGYVVIYGICAGIFSTILNNAVPESFGPEHIRIVEGLLGLAAGVGVIASEPADEKINEEYDWEASFYLGGSILILSGITALAAHWFLKDER